MFRTLEMRTEALVMGAGSVWEDLGDRVIQRTPSEPTYWYGNRVIWRVPPTDLERHLAAMAEAFPEAPHGVVTWDVPDMAPPDGLPDGWQLDHAQTMALEGQIAEAADPEGLALRPIETDEDWAQVVALQTETTVPEGEPVLPAHAEFQARRFAHRRADCAAGRSAWFGAFDGDLLVGDMGIVVGQGLARYQNVETRPSHRRRGIAATLLRHALRWARDRDPECLAVIVADRDSAPGRLYARAGFTVHETTVTLFKPGY